MVVLSTIYTRTGDDGSTGLGDFSRTSKNDPRLVASHLRGRPGGGWTFLAATASLGSRASQDDGDLVSRRRGTEKSSSLVFFFVSCELKLINFVSPGKEN